MKEQEARKQILQSVEEYARLFHNQEKEFQPGDRIAYASRVYGPEEMTALVDSALDFWLSAGRYTRLFEQRFQELLQVRFCSVVNSGSSANLLAFWSLTSPLLKERAIRRGDEVITVAAGFPTTVAPILQFGAVPVFVDITMPTYNIDVTKLEDALSEKTKAVMIAHTLGNPYDIKCVKAFCEKHGLWLIEDNCDALGAKFVLDGKEQYTGTIGDIGTSSFYPAHHITMGEGGAVYTNDPLLHKIVRSMRDWGRDCICESGQDNRCGHRFEGQYGQLPKGYDHKYVYSHFGFNLKISEMQAAVGCQQLERLDYIVKRRNENFALLKELLLPYSDSILLPEATDGAVPSWFGFLIACKEGLSKQQVVEKMEAKGIQTRNLFAGNIIKHPCFDTIREDESAYRIVGDLTNTDKAMNDAFWIGVYPGMTEAKIRYMADTLAEIINEK